MAIEAIITTRDDHDDLLIWHLNKKNILVHCDIWSMCARDDVSYCPAFKKENIWYWWYILCGIIGNKKIYFDCTLIICISFIWSFRAGIEHWISFVYNVAWSSSQWNMKSEIWNLYHFLSFPDSLVLSLSLSLSLSLFTFSLSLIIHTDTPKYHPQIRQAIISRLPQTLLVKSLSFYILQILRNYAPLPIISLHLPAPLPPYTPLTTSF